MGILLLIVPLLIYYVLIVPILKIKVINEIQSKKLKTLAFILLLLFPIGDHLIGYVVYKALCYTKGGVNIYKTVTDEQEQRDYWFYDGLNVLTNTFEDKEYKYLSSNKLVRRDIGSKAYKIYLENNLIDNIDNNSKLKTVYLNYCNPKHNTLPKTDPNYKQSCTNADKIIKKYKLKNVIEVPSSPYSFYSIASDKGSSREVFLFPFIGKDYQKIYNMKTGEILAEYKGFSFWGGWYINLFNPYHPSALSRCGKKDSKDLYSFKELVIPNPYKNKKKD